MVNATPESVLKEIRTLSNPAAVAGMARFGINPARTLGVSIPNLRRIARGLGKNHRLAEQLWASGIHEARILAGMIDPPEAVTEKQMERWVRAFDSWDVCDQVCLNLFRYTPLAYDKAAAWSRRAEEFVRRAGFVLMATLAVADKAAPDRRFARFFPLIVRASGDDRNFVKKAVNWALRQIGKRNAVLHRQAVATARKLLRSESRHARWIAADALKELESSAVRKRVAISNRSLAHQKGQG